MVSDSDSQFRIRKSNTKLENLKVILWYSSIGHGGTGTFFNMIEQFVSRGLPAQFSNMWVPVHFSV